MIRAFFHVDDFGPQQGVKFLPHAICLTDPLVVWSPSAGLLKSSRDNFLEPRDILCLVDREDAPLRIAGRRDWILDKDFRNRHLWPLAQWDEDFDGKIRSMAIEDDPKPISERRVIMDCASKGYEKARTILDGPGGSGIVRELQQFYKDRSLPEGMQLKMHRRAAKRQSVALNILRDFIDHADATASTKSAVAIMPFERMDILQRIVPSPTATGVIGFGAPGRGNLTASDFHDAVEVLQRVKPVLSMSDLQTFLKSDLRRDLNELMFSARATASLGGHLAAQIEQAVINETMIEGFFHTRDPIKFAINIGTLVMAVIPVLLGHPDLGLVPIAVEFAAEAVKRPLRERSLIREAIQPGHPARSLFYLTFGRERPTRAEIDSLLARLLKG